MFRRFKAVFVSEGLLGNYRAQSVDLQGLKSYACLPKLMTIKMKRISEGCNSRRKVLMLKREIIQIEKYREGVIPSDRDQTKRLGKRAGRDHSRYFIPTRGRGSIPMG